MILYRKALEMCTYENFASWSRTLFSVPSCTLLIHFYDWCVFRYSMKHLCKTFRHTPLPFPLTPPPPPLSIHRANLGSQRPKKNFKAIHVFLKMTNRLITNISRTTSLQGFNQMLSNFNISKGQLSRRQSSMLLEASIHLVSYRVCNEHHF